MADHGLAIFSFFFENMPMLKAECGIYVHGNEIRERGLETGRGLQKA